ncbi:hypothetical protein E2K80_18935 [Rhodophyticola sp. CCM32]|uniref:hypothetical protein n=1 Tax=Rhodophyticola sp. CCM32 TaxID=2916397 RepID=UPI00107FA70A|nr:hypothetical protein [Rhodophyticola sp. CCM32]QBY02558.1 hypothetical protein E2K80_18935 [Rhodophyticola sp. CCM32]
MAKYPAEPKAVIVTSCCARMQRDNYRNSAKRYAAARRESQSFMPPAAETVGPWIELRTKREFALATPITPMLLSRKLHPKEYFLLVLKTANFTSVTKG